MSIARLSHVEVIINLLLSAMTCLGLFQPGAAHGALGAGLLAVFSLSSLILVVLACTNDRGH